jgi:transposase
MTGSLQATQLLLSARHRFRAQGALYQDVSKNKTQGVPQPPYSPDLSPAYFFLSPKYKISLKGCGFTSVEEIQEKTLEQLTHSSSKWGRDGKFLESY